MPHNNVPAAAQPQPTQPSSDLVTTLQRCVKVLDAVNNRDDVPMARLAACRRGLVTTSAFLQTAEQAGIAALGVDFVAAARWLSGYYEHAAEGLREQSKPLLLSGNGQVLNNAPTATQLQHVGEALVATASMWREVGDAAQRPGYDEMVERYDAWVKTAGWHGGSGATQDDAAVRGEPDADLLEYFGNVAPDMATVPGILRIWTSVVAALCNAVTSGQLRGGRQEVVVMTQLMVQTAREAAVMAATLGGVETSIEQRSSDEPDANDCWRDDTKASA